MDQIQKVLIKAGRKDLAQEYYRKFALKRKASPLLQRGETIENGNVRIHRYNKALEVFDLTNAGKRGKTVDKISISYYDENDNILRLIQEIAKEDNFEKIVKMIKDNEKEVGTPYESKLKGVEVKPKGFKEIKIVVPGKVFIEADFDSFTIRDLSDPINEPTCIPSSRGKKTSINQFYRWLTDNEDKVKSMSYGDVTNELRKNNIDYHSYCAVD